jgi:RimJ/RimL family protein N-acetyltransferase
MWLDVYDFNARARHVYERLGFVHEATFRHALFRGGRFVDVHRLGILAEEWPLGAHRPSSNEAV